MTMTFEEYRAIDAVNQSTLKHIDVSPQHYLCELERKHIDTESIRVGQAAHCIALEPLEYPKRYATYEGRRDKRHTAYQEFLAANRGKAILSPSEHDRAAAVGLAVHADPLAMAALDGEHEVTLQWIDKETGIKCKARLDAINSGVSDLKTTRSIDKRQFEAQATRLHYHTQLAWYHDGALACGYELTELPRIVAVESSKPHCCAVFRLPESVVDVGRATYRGWLDRLRHCLDTNEWPGPYEGEVDFSLPAWFGASDADFFADMEVAA